MATYLFFAYLWYFEVKQTLINYLASNIFILMIYLFFSFSIEMYHYIIQCLSATREKQSSDKIKANIISPFHFFTVRKLIESIKESKKNQTKNDHYLLQSAVILLQKHTFFIFFYNDSFNKTKNTNNLCLIHCNKTWIIIFNN